MTQKLQSLYNFISILEITEQLASVPADSVATTETATADDALGRRLAALRS